jgi:ElaB/YqjD/DUF883 family membrane-anchored ribosome-binding protein
VRWYHIQRELRGNETQEKLSDPEKAKKLKDKIKSKVEKTAQQLEQLNTLAEQASAEEQDEVRGLTQAAVKEIQRTSRNFFASGEIEPDTKKRIPRSEEYMEYIRNMPDPIDGTTNVDPHHCDVGGTGIKGSDFSCIPLSREHHNEIEDNTESWFEDKYNVDLNELQKQYMHYFLTGERMEGFQIPLPSEADNA